MEHLVASHPLQVAATRKFQTSRFSPFLNPSDHARAAMHATILSPRATLFPCKPLFPSQNAHDSRRRRRSTISCSVQPVTADPSPPPLTDSPRSSTSTARESRSPSPRRVASHPPRRGLVRRRSAEAPDRDIVGLVRREHVQYASAEAVGGGEGGVEGAGMVGFRFNTIGWYDANISILMPGTIMAMGRLNRPGIMVYGGTIKPGHFEEKTYDIVSAFQSYGEFVGGSISDEQRKTVLHNACPGAGACGGMYTANTMASAIEAMGMSLLTELLKMELKPRDIITPKSLRNAITVMALGGSPMLYCILLLLPDLKPSGKYVMEDIHKIGGTPAVLRYLLEAGFMDGDCITVTGQTLAQNLENVPRLPENQVIIRPVSNPIKETGHIQILRGDLAPEGSVAKITGKEGLYFSGPALVFEGEESMLAAISADPMSFKGTVVVIRGEGPKGGPGMPEMLTPTSAIMGAGLGKECALLTDGRFSGGSHGFVVGHICPEAQEGGPIGLVKNGDIITIDIGKKRIDTQVSPEEMNERKRKWTAPAYKVNRGVLYKYIKNVQSASAGCVTDE
ncbi:hypothetical protein HID58_004035 [Brassica napus]|uniref:Dihydroxy-acid dehydratase n=1 Tax=Brassica napus TaxID=3708 RepID=A0ABQ7XIF3_BRANA|nr:hypothetical protein HID58_004035 [Brassica napus]